MRLPETLTILREDLPSGKYNVTIKCPYYGDLRKARKLFPYDTDNQGRAKSPGYSVEELLFCLQIVDIQDASGNSALSVTPKDVIDRLAIFSIKDRQALLSIFLEIFWLSAESAKLGKALANEFMITAAMSYNIPKDKLPSQNYSVSYNVPNAGIQMAVDRQYQGPQEHGCSLEEMLLAKCLYQINGEVIEKPKDTISVLDNWEIADVQFVNQVFINQSVIDESEAEKARDAGKRYLASFGANKSEASSTKARITTKASADAAEPANT